MGDVRKGVYGSYLNKKMTRHPWVLNAANLRATSLTPELLGPEMPSANAVVSNVVEMLQGGCGSGVCVCGGVVALSVITCSEACQSHSGLLSSWPWRAAVISLY